MSALRPLAADTVNRVLRREMLTFFTRLQSPEKNWPGIPTERMLDAVADTMLAWGQQQGMGSSALRVLTLELQERIPQPRQNVAGQADAARKGQSKTAVFHYPHSSLDIYFEGLPAVFDIDCKVQLSGTQCVLTYDEEAASGPRFRWKQWIGFAPSDGHYEMREAEGGHATLHRMGPDSAYLEGFWKEDGYTGMWRVKLGAEAPTRD